MTASTETETSATAWPSHLPRDRALYSVKSPDGKCWLAGVAKRTYALCIGAGRARVVLADRQAPIVLSPLGRVDERGALIELLDDIDVAPPKLATDVVVTGRVRLDAPARRHCVGIAIGPAARAVELVGPRRASVDVRGGVSFEEPAPFTEQELGLRHAYGGHDRFAQQGFDRGRAWFDSCQPASLVGAPPSDLPGLRPASWTPSTRFGGEPPALAPAPGPYAYARNHAGVGFFIDVDRRHADGAPLPTIEDPDDRLTPSRFFMRGLDGWIDQPIAAHLGWVPYGAYPRARRLVAPSVRHATPAHGISEARFADGIDLTTAPDPDERAAVRRGLQGAAPGLAVAKLDGTETLRMAGFFPEDMDFRCSLPQDRPRMRISVPDIDAGRGETTLETIRIDVERRELTLSWLTKLRVVCPIPSQDLEHCKLEVVWEKPS